VAGIMTPPPESRRRFRRSTTASRLNHSAYDQHIQTRTVACELLASSRWAVRGASKTLQQARSPEVVTERGRHGTQVKHWTGTSAEKHSTEKTRHGTSSRCKECLAMMDVPPPRRVAELARRRRSVPKYSWAGNPVWPNALTVGWAWGCCAGRSERHSESLTDMGIELESLHAANREQQVGPRERRRLV
jgi:uncharacterized membrane protein